MDTWAKSQGLVIANPEAVKLVSAKLLAEKTIDETVLQALQKKEDLAKTVVDDWRQLFSEGG